MQGRGRRMAGTAGHQLAPGIGLVSGEEDSDRARYSSSFGLHIPRVQAHKLHVYRLTSVNTDDGTHHVLAAKMLSAH